MTSRLAVKLACVAALFAPVARPRTLEERLARVERALVARGAP